MSTLFGSDVAIKSILNLFQNKKLTYLKNIVIYDKEISDQLQDLAKKAGLNILKYHELIDGLRESGSTNIQPVEDNLDTVFTISYTSGTSGNSKGVLLTNRNFLSAMMNIKAMSAQFSSQFNFSETDSYISYLPLAHVFDRLGVHSMLSVGGAVGFFGGVIPEITKDLAILKPTVFVSVPRLLNKVYEKVLAAVEEKPFVSRFLFHQGLNTKGYYNKENGWVNNKLFDYFVFSKAKQRLGGNVRIMITASAPIAPNVLNFLRCVFCCPIVEAYGQTESCGASFATKIFDNRSGHVGGPGVGVEFKLADLPDMNYTRDSKPYPAGEICIRGPAVFEGYFKNKQLTDETLDKDGWLRTGDVGCLTEQKKLKIIDRAKNIFKLS